MHEASSSGPNAGSSVKFFNISDGSVGPTELVKTLKAKLSRIQNEYLLDKSVFPEEDDYMVHQRGQMDDLQKRIETIELSIAPPWAQGVPTPGELQSAQARAKNAMLEVDRANEEVEKAQNTLDDLKIKAQEAAQASIAADQKVADLHRRFADHADKHDGGGDARMPSSVNIEGCSKDIVKSINDKVRDNPNPQFDDLVSLVTSLMVNHGFHDSSDGPSPITQTATTPENPYATHLRPSSEPTGEPPAKKPCTSAQPLSGTAGTVVEAPGTSSVDLIDLSGSGGIGPVRRTTQNYRLTPYDELWEAAKNCG